ncbi:PD-(D/E)XK nuclease family protein [Acidobacteria bacterium AH-259-L09]|nr:PD-(D/E)XK nuclease family protein [Acidobacteria bacterium AH-259-L09]
MPLKKLITYHAFDQAKQATGDWIRDQVGTELLVIAPMRAAADDLVYDLITMGREGLLGLHRMTPMQLAGILATEELAEHSLTPLSSLGAEAVASRCLFRSREEKGLSYFEPVAGMPGFTRALARTLLDLRLERVNSSSLASSGPPGPDLSTLLLLFQEELKSQSFADLARLYSLAADAAREGKGYLLSLPVVLLDVAPRSKLEREFYGAMLSRAPQVLAVVGAHDKVAIGNLERVLDVTGEPIDESVTTGSSLDRLRHYLLSAKEIPSGEPDGSFEFFSAPSEGRECVEIARRILQAAEQDVVFDEIAVLLPNPGLYQPQLEDAFRRAGIPGYFTRGAVRPDPAGRAFLTLMACVTESLSASSFAEYLSFGQLPPLEESGAPPTKEAPWITPTDELQMIFKAEIPETGAATESSETANETDSERVIAGTLRTPRHWEKLLVDAAVIGGKDRWVRRLKGLEAELALKFRSVDEEDARKEFLQGQLSRLKNLRDFALPVIEFLDSLPDEARWGEWLDHLRQLAAMTLRSAESVLGVLAELEPMENVGPVGLAEVQEVLSERLTFLRVEPPERRYGRVFVGTIQEAAARSFEIVFLPGLAEGIFPRKVFEDPLLLDEYRVVLSSELATRKDKLEEERLLLHIAVGAASHRLVASYPRMDLVQGRARVPSLYALELLRAAEGRLPDLKQIEKRAAETSSSRLGWPAPPETNQAIDAAEFDLATLDPLLFGRNGDITGKGNFLLEVNPSLGRSLRARYKRWRMPWSDDDGIVASKDPATRRILEKHRLSSRSYSPTALQLFAACPYRFFLHGIQGLQPREEAVAIEQMDPLTRGSLFHAVQYELFRRLQAEDLLPMTPGQLDRIIEIVEAVLDQLESEYRELLAPAIPQIWKTEIEDLRVDLGAWMREVVRKDQQWKPIHFEYSFGLPLQEGRDSRSTEKEAVILDGVRLRGVIDLVEKNEEQESLRVTDHKTGKTPWPRPGFVGKGEVLQPLLYALAAEKLLEVSVTSGRLYYCTQRGAFSHYDIEISGEALQEIGQVTQSIDQAIEAGFLPAAPRRDACRYCDFRAICGPYEELRVTRKHAGPLVPLEELRRMK